MGLDHLTRLESRETGGSLDDELPDAHLFRVEVVSDQFIEIAEFLASRRAPEAYTLKQWRLLVTRAADYQLI